MKKIRKMISILVAITITVPMLFLGGKPVLAAGEDHQQSPTNLNAVVSPYDYIQGVQQATLSWTKPQDIPASVAATDTANYGTITESGYELSISESSNNFVVYTTIIGLNTTSIQISRDLKPGTVYYAKLLAYHKHRNDVGTETVHKSYVTATLKFLTDVTVGVRTVDSNSIEVQWDDVKLEGNRISYTLVVDERSDFSSATKYEIVPESVGSSGPVFAISGGRLKYTVKSLKAGTVYYVKVIPKLSDKTVKTNTDIQYKVMYTKIIYSVIKLTSDDAGEWWKISWNSLTNATLSSGTQVVYQILRGDSTIANDVPKYIGQTSQNNYYVNNISGNYFYIIVAENIADDKARQIVDESGNTGIRSAKIYLTETATPAKPLVPIFKDKITEPGGTERYDITANPWLKGDSFTLAWEPNKSAGGTVDNDILYDLWILTNPADIDNAQATKFADGVKAAELGKISIPASSTNTADIKVYTLAVEKRLPNTVYYIKLTAKKLYTVTTKNSSGQDVITQQYISSNPALKVIVTPPSGGVDSPVAPAKPPLQVRKVKDSSGNDTNQNDVGKTNVWMKWRTMWIEEWLVNPTTSVGGWVYRQDQASVTGSVYRTVSYDSDVYFRVGYTPYIDGIKLEDIKDSSKYPYQVDNITNSATNNIIEYNLTGLTANTKYLIWLGAYRKNGLSSEPSDPVIGVTDPGTVTLAEKPSVPIFVDPAPLIRDEAIGLQWNWKDGYTYYIRYGTTDEFASSSAKDITVTPGDLASVSIYKVEGLKADTSYYFWIRADSTGSKDANSMSLWSDSILVRTKPYNPPEVPTGFGLKSTTEKTSLGFQWNKVGSLEYTLELAVDPDFKTKKVYKAGNVSEFTVSSLLSNHRYYVRLYAYDSTKKTQSGYTGVIVARTPRSNDEFDSDSDNETEITGPFITETVIDRTWTVSITGVNADRLVELMQKDNVLDYRLDLSEKSSGRSFDKRVVQVSGKVFETLSQLKENLVLDAGGSRVAIRPDVFGTAQIKQLKNRAADYTIEISMEEKSSTYSANESGLQFKTGIIVIGINAVNGSEIKPVVQLGRPLKISFKYEDANFFVEGVTGGYALAENETKWTNKAAKTKFDEVNKTGYVYFDMSYPGKAALMNKISVQSGNFSDLYGHPASYQINSIAGKYNLKSIDKGAFRPYRLMTLDDAAKLMLDILGYSYGSDFMSKAAKAGFLAPWDVNNAASACTWRTAYKMIDRLYEMKTGLKAPAREYNDSDYNGINRAEMMMELYKMLNSINEL